MFGKNKESAEYLNYNVEPSENGKKLLAEEALNRIETIDGVDYLDGIKLPPDNDEVHGGPKTYNIHTTYVHHRINERGKSEWAFTEKVHTFESDFTNRKAREANIGLIALGHMPLFILWKDVLIKPQPPKPTTFKRVKAHAERILDKVVG